MKLSTILVVGLSALILFATVGCGDNPGKPEAVGTETEVQNARDARKIFDGVKGDYSKVTEEDKAKLEKMYGKERAEAVWAKMKNPYAPGPGAVKPAGGSSTPNPVTGG